MGLAIDGNGKVVAVGHKAGIDFALARYNTDGSLDTNFGTGGKVVTSSIADKAYAVKVKADGDLIVGGSYGDDFLVIRYDSNGSIDTGFSEDGYAYATMGSGGERIAMAVQSDGKILTVGTFYDGDMEVRAARLLPPISDAEARPTRPWHT